MSFSEEYREDRLSTNNISSCLYEEMVSCATSCGLRLPELPEETILPLSIELTGCPVSEPNVPSFKSGDAQVST